MRNRKKRHKLVYKLIKRLRGVYTWQEAHKTIKDWYVEVEKLGDPTLSALAFQDYYISHHIVEEPILSKIIIVTGILSGISIVGGIIAIVWNSVSPTEFTIFSVKLTTGSVGVALVGLGLFCMLFVFKDVLKYLIKKLENKGQ